MKLNLHNADLMTSVVSSDRFPRDPRPQIALSGRSNVGKSSLINTLLGRKSLARVSSAPGKTVTINYYDIDGKIFLVDLPGYGFAARSQESKRSWSRLTEDYFLKNPSHDALRLVLQLIDVRTGPTDDDRLMLRFLQESGNPYRIVLTKTDKLSPTALRARVDEIAAEFPEEAGTPVPFSSVNRQGRDELWDAVYASFC